MAEPLVSILIPFKNTEAFIAECLNSIFNQTYQNWECICVDDCSTDNSTSIVADFAEKDSRFKLYKNEGVGIIPALRLAFKNCSGNYVTRMDSDDIMVENRLEIMLHNLEQYGSGHLAIGKVKYFKKEGLSDGYSKYEKWLNGLTKTGSNYSEIYKECVIPSPCWMLHRDDFVACGGFSPNRYPEDYDLAFRFYEAKYKVIPCDDILLLWRDYSTRTSRTHQHYAQNYFLDIKVHYFLKLDYDSDRPLTLWGAGNKGKSVAKLLIEKKIPFYWVCDNSKKIGKHIYGKELFNFNYLEDLKQPQSIITVANTNSQKEIKSYLNTQQMEPTTDYFFFC